uniref:Pentatricopeptide repeat-containing protein n=1 Tax=Kalanchoe fedtschenkoi TaxID=63787 RepID=A0A7N0UAC8_KALFE
MAAAAGKTVSGAARRLSSLFPSTLQSFSPSIQPKADSDAKVTGNENEEKQKKRSTTVKPKSAEKASKFIKGTEKRSKRVSSPERKQSNKNPKYTDKALAISQLVNARPWNDDLETTLTSSHASSLSKTTVVQTLRLIRTPTKALNFFHWVRKLNAALHDDNSYFFILELLGRSRNLNAARNFLFSIDAKSGGSVKVKDRFFNSLIRSYGKAGLFHESLKLFQAMKTAGVAPSVVTFNNVLTILLDKGRTNFAHKVFDEMLATYGVTPDVYTFNILIRGFCVNSMVDEAFHFFKKMARLNCEADVVTYNTIVDGLCRAGKVNIARNVVKGMARKGGGLSPNVVTYTTLVRGYCKKGAIDEALALFDEMVARGLKPNRVSYNTLIQGLCEARRLDEIKGVLDGGDFVPDTCTFNTLMNAHCGAGRVDEAVSVYEKMLELGARPDSASYSVLIRGLCQNRDFSRAEELFDELAEKEILLSEDGCVPLAAAYNPMFEHLCANEKTEKAERVFRQLMRRGVQDPTAFKTLITGRCKEGKFDAAFELLVLMLRRDFVPDAETYDSIITGFLETKDPLPARQALEKMLKSSHQPRTATFHSILSLLVECGHAAESASLVRLMLEKGVRQNARASTDAVILLFRQGLHDEACELIRRIHANGFSVETDRVVEFLWRRRKLVAGCEVLLQSLEKDESVSLDLCGRVVSGLCRAKKVSEAFGLYGELVEKGRHRQLSCLEELRRALEADGRMLEAKFVHDRILEDGEEG